MAVDYSTGLYDKGEQKIICHHMPSGNSLAFKAWDLQYSETISNNWDSKQMIHRVNQRHTWQSVDRSISLSWSMPSFDLAEAKSNLAKCSAMVRFMYPAVDENGLVNNGNPVWALGLMNLIHKSDVQRAGATSDTLLKGFPTSFSWNIVASDGYLYDEGGTEPFPKHIKISMAYRCILDESKLFGWQGSSWTGPAHFPWSST